MSSTPNKPISEGGTTEPISEAAAQFQKTLIELFSFVGTAARQWQFFGPILNNLNEGFRLFPVEIRRSFIPDDAFDSMQEFLSKGIDLGAIMALYSPVLLELAFCRVVDSYLLYISGLLELIYRTRPEMLNATTETMTYAEILEHANFGDLLSTIIEKKVLRLAYKSIRDLNRETVKLMSFDLFENEDDLRMAAMIVENRNLFIHNRGIVNRLYLSRFEQKPPLVVGERLSRDQRVLEHHMVTLMRLVESTDRRAAEKFRIRRETPPPTGNLPEV
jgi:hypothetical protein